MIEAWWVHNYYYVYKVWNLTKFCAVATLMK